MSDEKRREELKAKIIELLDKLSIEELEKVSGGLIVEEVVISKDQKAKTVFSFYTDDDHKYLGSITGGTFEEAKKVAEKLGVSTDHIKIEKRILQK